MGLKSFSKKLEEEYLELDDGLKKKNNMLVGRIAKILSTISILPGKIGMIEKISSVISNVLHDKVSKIPNKDVRDRINDAIANGNEKFQELVDRGKETVPEH